MSQFRAKTPVERVGSLHPLAHTYPFHAMEVDRSKLSTVKVAETEELIRCIGRLAERQRRDAAREAALERRETRIWQDFLRERVAPLGTALLLVSIATWEIAKQGPLGIALVSLLGAWVACVVQIMVRVTSSNDHRTVLPRNSIR